MYISFTVWTAFISLIPFLCVAVLHLIYCFYDKQGYADITKMLLMPLLLCAYSIAVLAMGKIPSVLIAGALLASWSGDMFLLKSDRKSFIIGMLSFGVAHVLYIVFAAHRLAMIGNAVSIPIILPLIALYAASIVFLMLRLFRYLNMLTKSVFCYMLLIAAMSICFVLGATGQPSAASILAAVGSLFFVISDSVLAHVEFVGSFPKSRFVVMKTYILAQFCIVIAALLFLV